MMRDKDIATTTIIKVTIKTIHHKKRYHLMNDENKLKREREKI
jgi:hypothetical protein